MNDQQLLRYSRHILLNELGVEGQERLLKARALVVGAGGLGCPAALYLASAGVGRICIADADLVDATNLQRQILHHVDRIGTPKAQSARLSLLNINPEVETVALERYLEGMTLTEAVASADVVLDCSDNFETRHALNRACVAQHKALVSGAAIRFDGQISVYDQRQTGAPCYHCLFPEDEGEEENMRCAVMGVFAPLTGIIGASQAAEALKLLAGIGESLSGRLLILNALEMQWRQIFFQADPACKVCVGRGS